MNGSAIRGSRIGSNSFADGSTGEPAPRKRATFYCANGHATSPAFSIDASIPDEWECPRCGLPTNQDQKNPPAPPVTVPYKSHLAYVKERRSDSDAKAILSDALKQLRARRDLGEVFY